MVQKSKGYRTRTRKLLTKPIRKKGLHPLGKLLYQYKIGEKVIIKIDPSIHKGMPHKRFHGKIGRVIGFRGKGIIVEVKDFNKIKQIITLKEHLEPLR
ncbi:MAG: 50S ribosomal protein L21e [Candidatus Asgardarchaeia archaeon]